MIAMTVNKAPNEAISFACVYGPHDGRVYGPHNGHVYGPHDGNHFKLLLYFMTHLMCCLLFPTTGNIVHRF